MTLASPCTHALGAGACVATLLVTACAATAVTVTPSSIGAAPSNRTASPQPFAGTGFRTDIPRGWRDQTANQRAAATLGGSGTILMLLAAPDGALIVARTTSQPVADDQLAQYLTTAVPPGAVDAGQAEPIDVGGMSGVVITFVVTPSGGAAQEDEEMVVNQAGNTYEIALGAGQATFAHDTAALQQVLNSWRWA